MDRGNILQEAHEILNSRYKTSDGANEFSFNLIAQYWEVYLKSRGFNVQGLEAKDSQMMLTLFKIAREALQKQKDNIRDACGYLGLYADTEYPAENKTHSTIVFPTNGSVPVFKDESYESYLSDDNK